jgi:hypothetical protein
MNPNCVTIIPILFSISGHKHRSDKKSKNKELV